MERLAPQRGMDAVTAALGSGGGSGSGDSTGIRLPCSGSLPGSRPDYEQSRPSGLCLRDLDFLETKLVPPLGARVGDPISPQQHVVLDRLEQFADRLLVTPSFQPESLDRCGPKFAAFAKVAKELPGTRILGVDQLLLQLVQSLKGGLDPYGPVSAGARVEAQGSGPSEEFSTISRIGAGVAPDPAGGAAADLPSLKSLGTLGIQASRINWKHACCCLPRPGSHAKARLFRGLQARLSAR